MYLCDLCYSNQGFATKNDPWKTNEQKTYKTNFETKTTVPELELRNSRDSLKF